MENNSILFSNTDREDGWVMCGICFKIGDTKDKTYKDMYNELKPKLESKEMIDYIINKNSLDFNLFNEDDTFKFVKTYWDMGLIYVFENSDEYEKEFQFNKTDLILTF